MSLIQYLFIFTIFMIVHGSQDYSQHFDISNSNQNYEKHHLLNDYQSLLNNQRDIKAKIQKRFLKSLFGKKTKTSTAPTTSTTSTTVASSTKTFPSAISDGTSNDPFYILKTQCIANPFDTECKKRKDEMYELVKKCDALTKTKGTPIQACKDIYSSYCYVYSKQDLITCKTASYDEYIPGKKSSGVSTTTTKTSTVSSTSRTTTSTSTKSYSPIISDNVANDPFYILKKQCSANPFDTECKKRKNDMYELVKKCDALTKTKGTPIQACKDIYSLYCYVYSNQDLITCKTGYYDEYIPGKKTSSSISSTTSKYITLFSSTSFRTQSPYPSTQSMITKPTSKLTSNPIQSITKPTIQSSTKTAINDYPFNSIPDFTGTITSIPDDVNTLKAIGNFCLKLKTKDKNCDKLLILLKERFKTCEKKSTSDIECQKFKVKFCTAYPNFTCCSEVLAGRTCKSNPVNKRKAEFLNILKRFYY